MAANSTKPIAAGGVLALVAAVAAFVQPWEGRKLQPYKDIVGVVTWCDGITRGTPKAEYTQAECDALLRNEIAIHLRGVAKCIKRPLAEHEWVAVGSWTYNVGVQAACKSRLVEMVNAGAPPEAWCKQLLLWNKARKNGRLEPVRGLTRRREAEYAVCIGDS